MEAVCFSHFLGKSKRVIYYFWVGKDLEDVMIIWYEVSLIEENPYLTLPMANL